MMESTTIDRLDNEYPAFLRAQEAFGNPEQVKMEVTSSLLLRRYINPQRLQGALDEVQDATLSTAQREYLMLTGEFSESFLDYLETGLPSVKVMANLNEIKVVVEGTRSDVIQWEALIGVALHNQYYKGVIVLDRLNPDALIGESVRRLRAKGDMLRASGARFVEAGTRYRCDAEWYSWLVEMLIGDLGDSLLGTTNLFMAMSTGLTPWAHLDQKTLVERPSVEALGNLVDDAATVVVTGANAFQIAHLASHFEGTNLVFEWGEDLVSDTGAARTHLDLSWSVNPSLTVPEPVTL